MGRRSIPGEGPPEAQGALHHDATRRRREEEFTLTPKKRPGPPLHSLPDLASEFGWKHPLQLDGDIAKRQRKSLGQSLLHPWACDQVPRRQP